MSRKKRIQKSEFSSQNSEHEAEKPVIRTGWIMALAAVMLAGCASPPLPQFTDADWVSDTTTGRGCYERGDFRRAADAFGRAQQRARALDDADALAVAAVNRAVSLLAAGQADEALAGVDEALADARVADARRVELLVAGARAEAVLNRADAALARVDAALKLAPDATLKAQALMARSAAWLAKKDIAAATKALAEGMPAKDWDRLPASLRAEKAVQQAQIAVAAEKPAEAFTLQDEAAALWKQAGRLPEMARALAAAGRQAQAAGDLANACDRFYRSARSLWAQGIQPEAVKVLEEGVSCAEKLKDDAVGKRLADLFVTFKKSERLSK
mgnify:CR=1 FL=1